MVARRKNQIHLFSVNRALFSERSTDENIELKENI